MIPRPSQAKKNSSTLLEPWNLDPTELPPGQGQYTGAYDRYIVSFSGGKDSTLAVLILLEAGVPREKIELWHHCIDGEPGVDPRLWDWPCTEAYCKAFAEALGMPLYLQWKNGGFLREMLRENELTQLTTLQVPGGGTLQSVRGASAKIGTRMHFPLPVKELTKRWCSPSLKIEVAQKVFSTDPRFAQGEFLFLTGERREESGGMEKRGRVTLVGRALYEEVEKYKATTLKRRVDQWRPCLPFEESELWPLMEKYRIRPHPAYYLGWSRLSCMPCIFGDEHQWATVRQVDPQVFESLNRYEHEFTEYHLQRALADPERDPNKPIPKIYIKMPAKEFDPRYIPGVTVSGTPEYKLLKPTAADIVAWADRGTSYLAEGYDREMLELALGETYPTELILVPENQKWEMPKGAYGHSGGPT